MSLRDILRKLFEPPEIILIRGAFGVLCETRVLEKHGNFWKVHREDYLFPHWIDIRVETYIKIPEEGVVK